jgi:hypothetical protein
MLHYLIVIALWVTGLVVASFTLISALTSFFFAVPATRKLLSANMLKDASPLLFYRRSIGLLLSIFIVITAVIVLFAGKQLVTGYWGGVFFALLFGVRKVGKNKDNIDDYMRMNSRVLTQSSEEVTAFLVSK